MSSGQEIVLDFYTPEPKQALLHGTRARQILFGGAIGGGKLLRRGGVVLTPFGWRKCEHLKVGDRVNAPDGTTSRVVQLHPWVKVPGVRVTFHDGTSTVVAWDHLWLAWRSGKRRKRPNGGAVFGEAGAEVVETRELKRWLDGALEQERRGVTMKNWPQIPVCEPQVFNVAHRYKVELDPYQLGVWLGDGHIGEDGSIGITSVDHEHMAAFFPQAHYTGDGRSYRLKGDVRKHWVRQLKRAKLDKARSATKFIPREVLWGSIETRKAVLQGLMDTDGTADSRGQLYYCTTSKRLAGNVMTLVQSLGGTAVRSVKEPHYRDKDGQKVAGKTAYTLYIKLPNEREAFRMERKKARTTDKGLLSRRVVAIEEVGEIEGRCLTVSHPSGLYLTNDFIVTHNSAALRWDAIYFCLENPGCDAYLFRRNLKQLEDNHIRKLQQELPQGVATYNATRKRLEFPNGSGINFCYCEYERDVDQYQGAEMHWLGIDEAGQMTPYQLSYLRTRARLGSWKPERDKGRLPRVVMTANPGGVSHNYLKDVFMQTPPMVVFHDETMRDPRDPDDKGWASLFIPATMDDNPHLDAGYAASVGGLPEWQQRALRDGDWDVVAGAYFDCFGPANVVKPFAVPEHWTRFRACDYGHATPFWVGWLAVSDGTVEAERGDGSRVTIPEDALVLYREWYGSRGKNEGLRLLPSEIARRVKVAERGEHISYGVADPSMWRVDSGPSAAEHMARSGVYWRKGDSERVAGWQELYARLRGIEHWPEGTREADCVPGTGHFTPMLYIFDTCTEVLRELPAAQHDDRPNGNPEDVLKIGRREDHAIDGLRYGCMSRPYMTEKAAPKRDPTAPLTFDEMLQLDNLNRGRDYRRRI